MKRRFIVKTQMCGQEVYLAHRIFPRWSSDRNRAKLFSEAAAGRRIQAYGGEKVKK